MPLQIFLTRLCEVSRVVIIAVSKPRKTVSLSISHGPTILLKMCGIVDGEENIEMIERVAIENKDSEGSRVIYEGGDMFKLEGLKDTLESMNVHEFRRLVTDDVQMYFILVRALHSAAT